jgi:hypothetical protein
MNTNTESSALPSALTDPLAGSKKIIVRDENGLRIGIPHVFSADGLSVNWRAMLKPEHLCFNAQKAEVISQKLGIDVGAVKNAKVSDFPTDKIDDSDLLILLSGIKYLAWLRGYISVSNKIIKAEYNIATVETTIIWNLNFESDGEYISYSDSSSATLDNTSGFGSQYLTEVAVNRAFSRAVRNYLNINIVASEEIGTDKAFSKVRNPVAATAEPTATITKPKQLLEENIKKLGLTFDKFKSTFIKKYHKNPDADKNVKLDSDPETWKSIDDILDNDIYTLLSILSSR